MVLRGEGWLDCCAITSAVTITLLKRRVDLESRSVDRIKPGWIRKATTRGAITHRCVWYLSVERRLECAKTRKSEKLTSVQATTTAMVTIKEM